MIVSSPFDKDLLGHEGVNTSYYGLSALQAVINHDVKILQNICIETAWRSNHRIIINSLITTI